MPNVEYLFLRHLALRTGSDRQMRIFQTGRAELRKRNSNNNACHYDSTKQRRNFQTSRKKINNETHLGGNKCKYTNEMGLSVFITGL